MKGIRMQVQELTFEAGWRLAPDPASAGDVAGLEMPASEMCRRAGTSRLAADPTGEPGGGGNRIAPAGPERL